MAQRFFLQQKTSHGCGGTTKPSVKSFRQTNYLVGDFNPQQISVKMDVFPKWRFLKLVVPNNHGFLTKNDHFGVFWGYRHLRKHPNGVNMKNILNHHLAKDLELTIHWIYFSQTDGKWRFINKDSWTKKHVILVVTIACWVEGVDTNKTYTIWFPSEIKYCNRLAW